MAFLNALNFNKFFPNNKPIYLEFVETFGGIGLMLDLARVCTALVGREATLRGTQFMPRGYLQRPHRFMEWLTFWYKGSWASAATWRLINLLLHPSSSVAQHERVATPP